jgi:hypothetical protein
MTITPSVRGLMRSCQDKVVELKFVRRNKLRLPPTRRMFCTLNRELLNSLFGKEVLNFRKPIGYPPYNAEKYGLVTVWDILMQNYRNIPADSCIIIQAIDPDTKNNFKKFITFFDIHIRKMTPSQKVKFMGS